MFKVSSQNADSRTQTEDNDCFSGIFIVTIPKKDNYLDCTVLGNEISTTHAWD